MNEIWLNPLWIRININEKWLKCISLQRKYIYLMTVIYYSLYFEISQQKVLEPQTNLKKQE